MTDKLKAYRDSLTQEQKDNLLVQAKAARLAKAAEREANAHLLKTEYLDSNNWATLASKYKIRMPNKLDPTTSKLIRKYMKKLTLDLSVFNEHYNSMTYFISNNPRWSALATVGLLLELKDFYDKTSI